MRFFVMIMLLMSTLAGVFPATLNTALATSDASFEEVPCQNILPPLRGREMTCGYLTVPENRADPANEDTIRNFVVIVHARSADPLRDPVVYLQGGPGGATTGFVANFEFFFGALANDRDVVLMDQRGTGYSEPRLECPDFGLAMFNASALAETTEEGVRSAADVLLACEQDYLADGVDITAYTSAQNAADFEDLRLALGYEPWNLYGISYGTRLALTIMRDFPEGVRSAVIDSVAPPQRDLYVETPANGIAAYQVLFDSCAADPGCNETYPELQTVFNEVIEQLDVNPVTVKIRRGRDGALYDAILDGDYFAGSLFMTLYSTAAIRELPWIIYEARRGNYGPLTQQVLARQFIWDGIAVGMHFGVNCAEEIAFNTYEEVASASAELPEAMQPYFDVDGLVTWEICEDWGASTPDPIENEPVVSDVPTLIFAGENDPITPPIWAEAAAETLSNHYYYMIPGGGHGVTFAYNCAVQIMVEFLDDPSTEPSSACMEAVGTGPEFRLIPVSID